MLLMLWRLSRKGPARQLCPVVSTISFRLHVFSFLFCTSRANIATEQPVEVVSGWEGVSGASEFIASNHPVEPWRHSVPGIFDPDVQSP